MVRALHKFLETKDYKDYKEFSRIANEEHPTLISLLSEKVLGIIEEKKEQLGKEVFIELL